MRLPWWRVYTWLSRCVSVARAELCSPVSCSCCWLSVLLLPGLVAPPPRELVPATVAQASANVSIASRKSMLYPREMGDNEQWGLLCQQGRCQPVYRGAVVTYLLLWFDTGLSRQTTCWSLGAHPDPYKFSSNPQTYHQLLQNPSHQPVAMVTGRIIRGGGGRKWVSNPWHNPRHKHPAKPRLQSPQHGGLAGRITNTTWPYRTNERIPQ